MKSNITQAKHPAASPGLAAGVVGEAGGGQSGSGLPDRNENAGSRNLLVRWIKDRMFTIILVTALFVGLFLLAYPSFADYWNSFHQSRAVMTYAENVANMNTEENERILDKARI